MRPASIRILFLACCLLPLSAHAAIARELDAELGRARALVEAGEGACSDQQVRELKEIIALADGASADLHKKIDSLERIQTMLTSGLIGALVTAAVAVIGALTNFRRSRADRDFRRLEVLEKATQLQASGIGVPPDILQDYANRP